MLSRRLACIVVGIVALGACLSSSSSEAPTVDGGREASVLDAGHPADATGEGGDSAVDKSKTCVSTFGQALDTVGFARFDGTVVAVIPPDDQACAEPNSTHLIIEMSFSGAVYRMVMDVNDEDAPDTIHATTLSHALIGAPWSDGWHSVPLDYVATLGLHSTDLPGESTARAVADITDALDFGAHVSVFATAQGEPDSAHLVHRNLTNQDGALVVGVDGSPTWLLFAFSDQTF